MKLQTIVVALVAALAAVQGVQGKLTSLRGGTKGERGLFPAGYDYKYGFLVSHIRDDEYWCITAPYGVSINKEVTLNRCNFKREPAKQLWRFDDKGRIHSKVNPDRCIIVGDGKYAKKGAHLKMHDCDKYTHYNKFKHNGGVDHIQLKEDDNYCVTNIGSNPDPHENMIITPCGYGGDYKFHYKVIDHYYPSSPDHYDDKDPSSPDHYDPEPYYSDEGDKDHYYPSSPDHYDDKDHYYPSSPDHHYDPEPYYSDEGDKDHYYPSSPDHYDPEPYYSDEDDKDHYYPSSPDHYDDKDHYYPSSPDHYDAEPYYSDEDDKDHYYPSSPDHYDDSPDHYDYSPDHSYDSPDHYDPEPYYSDEDDKDHYYPSSPDHYDDSPDHYDDSPDHYDDSPDHYDDSPDHYDDKDHYYPSSPDHYSYDDHDKYSSDDGYHHPKYDYFVIKSKSKAEFHPKYKKGCLTVKRAKNDQKLLLGSCHGAKGWRIDGDGLIHSELNDYKCIQADRHGSPKKGSMMRLFDCDKNNKLQRFEYKNGQARLKGYNLCIAFRGVIGNVNEDPILLKPCNDETTVWGELEHTY